MNAKLEATLSVALTLAAVVLAATAVHRQVSGTSPRPARPELVDEWEMLLASGDRIGSATAPVQIVEMGDFECPFCKLLHEDIRALQAAYPNQVALTYVHFPLAGHRNADAAARAAECAGRQGAFAAMYDQLFSAQDSLGVTPWTELAVAAGVPDPLALEACMEQPSTAAAVEGDRELSIAMGAQGTPTVFINGWRIPRPPSGDSLTVWTESFLEGRTPFGR